MKTAAFRDQGRILATERADPAAIRDMIAIARHRRWTVVMTRGTQAFRREAWLEGRAAGLEVRGYRPSERDLQDLARRTARRRPDPTSNRPRQRVAADVRDGARNRLSAVESVVRARLVDPAAQARVLAAARARVADWLEQGAWFAPFPTRTPSRTRDRTSR